MEMCAREYDDLHRGHLPETPDEYWQIRLGTSSVYAGCVLGE